MATRTGTQRRTQNSQKALMDDDDYELMFSQSPPNKIHVDQRIEEDDDLMLFLSQSQQHEVLSCESTVNGLAASAASMKTNIAQVENIIKKNNSILAKQNDTVLKLIHKISANVNEMNERVNILEQKLCTLNNSVNKNKENVTAINRKLLKLENTVNIIKTDYKKFGRPTTQGNYEERLTQLENKLKYAETKEETSRHIRENLNYDRLQKTDHTVYIKKIPFGQNDSNDVKKLITDGLGLNVLYKCVILREPLLCTITLGF